MNPNCICISCFVLVGVLFTHPWLSLMLKVDEIVDDVRTYVLNVVVLLHYCCIVLSVGPQEE